jgi:hypothetical protein
MSSRALTLDPACHLALSCNDGIQARLKALEAKYGYRIVPAGFSSVCATKR